MEWEWLAADGQLAKPLSRRRTKGSQPDRWSQRSVKRSLLCEGMGVPLGIEVAYADIRAERPVRATLESGPIELPIHPGDQTGLCLDRGRGYSDVYQSLAEFGFTAHVRACSQEAEADSTDRATELGPKTEAMFRHLGLLRQNWRKA